MAQSTFDPLAVRHATGLNQSEFWGRLGVTQSGGSRYERGRPCPAPVCLLLDVAYGDAALSRETVKRLRTGDA
jgi:transcriptional regulator with XRE-family HTH domain